MGQEVERVISELNLRLDNCEKNLDSFFGSAYGPDKFDKDYNDLNDMIRSLEIGGADVEDYKERGREVYSRMESLELDILDLGWRRVRGKKGLKSGKVMEMKILELDDVLN